jgi:hypothetical protein
VESHELETKLISTVESKLEKSSFLLTKIIHTSPFDCYYCGLNSHSAASCPDFLGDPTDSYASKTQQNEKVSNNPSPSFSQPPIHPQPAPVPPILNRPASIIPIVSAPLQPAPSQLAPLQPSQIASSVSIPLASAQSLPEINPPRPPHAAFPSRAFLNKYLLRDFFLGS